MVQLMRFAAVGGLGFVVDVTVFNLLRAHDPFGWAWWPVAAKAASTLLAIAVNWIGNRMWTFREHRRSDTGREAAEFLIASLIGGGVSLMCLVFSRDVLGLTSALDDNISANVIGLALGSAVRFCAYRWWVFGEGRSGVGEETGIRMPTSAPSALSEEMVAEPPASAATRATMARPSPPPA
jgi:putative flippase GtrA